MCAFWVFTPFPFIRRKASIRAPGPTRSFCGSHPRSSPVPPNGRESIIATDQPALRHLKAGADAAGPCSDRDEVELLQLLASLISAVTLPSRGSLHQLSPLRGLWCRFSRHRMLLGLPSSHTTPLLWILR